MVNWRQAFFRRLEDVVVPGKEYCTSTLVEIAKAHRMPNYRGRMNKLGLSIPSSQQLGRWLVTRPGWTMGVDTQHHRTWRYKTPKVRK